MTCARRVPPQSPPHFSAALQRQPVRTSTFRHGPHFLYSTLFGATAHLSAPWSRPALSSRAGPPGFSASRDLTELMAPSFLKHLPHLASRSSQPLPCRLWLPCHRRRADGWQGSRLRPCPVPHPTPPCRADCPPGDLGPLVPLLIFVKIL